jgi:hypothetical protein
MRRVEGAGLERGGITAAEEAKKKESESPHALGESSRMLLDSERVSTGTHG